MDIPDPAFLPTAQHFVAIEEPYELLDWALRWHTSPERIVEAVRAVGDSTLAVMGYLGVG